MELTRLQQVLAGQEENYILPFFWQHGEDEVTLREYMNAIHDANIGAVCLEARPHPAFAEEKWWNDLDVILDEAKKLGMKVWILDDAHFPSGQAGGKMDQAPDELQKQYLNYHIVDVCGPMRSASVDVAGMAKYYKNPFAPTDPFSMMEGKQAREYTDDTLMAVIASRLDGKENEIYHFDDTLIDLTDQVRNGVLTWDVPEGTWWIFVIYATRNGGGRSGYVNFLSKRSCRLQIDAVYEPHYAHYKEEFGKTIAGFFSDEPEVGNMSGYGTDIAVGRHDMPLPWSEEMPALMEERFGKDYLRLVPALWFPVGADDFTAGIRVGYMDLVSRQCQKNFGEQIGDWCREHGVEYIGHVLEDNGISTSLGAGQGHFFRALRGQDWAGVDDIGGQVTEGGENIAHRGVIGSDGDGEFYHHELIKLGTSLGDIDPRKEGRVLCEAFGAYGWYEGTRMMKYIADHLLVRGVNRHTPHAFSPKEFPDPDCPPHFYAHGKNPLYKPFGSLMKYMNRISHLITGGFHVVEVAVLYHAEQDWSGLYSEDVQNIARLLDDVQIDFTIMPDDVFTEREYYKTFVDGEGLHVNGHTYKAFVVPRGDYIPEGTRAFAKEAAAYGIPVFRLKADDTQEGMICMDLHDLAGELIRRGITDVVADKPFKQLQTYHYENERETYYLISNESVGEKFEGKVKLGVSGKALGYDAMTNTVYEPEQDADGIALTLEPYEMAVFVIPKADEKELNAAVSALPKSGCKVAARVIGTVTGFDVSFVENENYPAFGKPIHMEKAENVLNYKPDFSGVIRYDAEFTADEVPSLLEIEDARESVEVWCNGKYAGERLCPPYRFDLGGAATAGKNEIRMEVRTTLERRVHVLTGGMGFLGPEFHVVPPEGIIGEVRILK